MSSRRFPVKPVLALLGIAALVAAGRLFPVVSWLTALQAWVSAHGALGMVLFFIVYVVVTVLMGPAWLLTIAAGLTWSFPVALPLALLSATAGATSAFLLGRTLARHRVEALVAKNDVLAAIDRAVAKKGWRIVFLLRLSLARTNGRPRSRAFIDFLLAQFPEKEGVFTEPGSRLIVP